MVSISIGASSKLDKSGGTLTGPLILARDPQQPLEAATRQWVLANGGGIPASTVTAKGDLLAATGSATVTRLGAGSNGQVLTAASGQAAGLQWTSLPGSLPPNGSAGGDLTGTYPNPALAATGNVLGIIRANRLDQFAAPTAAVPMNGQKITLVGNGAASTDVAAFGQIPLVGAAGAGAGVALSSTDASVTNARTPTAHVSTHASGGSDAVTPNAIGALNGLTRTPVKTSAYTAQAGDVVPVDTTAGSVPITLAAAPGDKAVIAVKHIIQGAANTVTITCGGSDVFNKTGGGTTLTLTLVNQGVLLEYTATGAIWTVLSDDLPLGVLDTRYVLVSALPLPIASGGTGQTTAQTALNALAGTQTAGRFLRGDGSNVSMSAIQASDVPTLNQNTTGTAAGLSATLAIASGGTGSATKNFVDLTTTQSVAGAKTFTTSIASPAIQLSTSPISGGIASSDGSGNVSWAYSAASAGPVNISAFRFGLVAETIPLYQCNLRGNLASGTLALALIWWPAGKTLSKLSCYVGTAGTTLSGTNSLGLYTSAGSLVTTTGDMTSQFGATGWQEGTLSSPQTPTADTIYYVGALTHAAGTLPAIQAFNLVNTFGAVNGVYGAISVSGQTNHASFTPSAATLVNGAYWFGAR